MSSKEIGIEDARKRLGDIVTAVQQGADIVLTRNGKAAARIVTTKETPVSTIAYVSHRPADDSYEIPPLAGSFNPRAGAQYWPGDGKPRRIHVGPDEVLENREGERLWRTEDGRWIVTRHGEAVDKNYLVTDAEAEQWFADNGYSDEDRVTYLRTL